MILSVVAGIILSAIVGLAGYWRGSLSRSGIVGAILTGTPIFGFGGVVWGGLLIAFFVSSSVLSGYRAGAKAFLAEKFQKGSRRDLEQALANGGWAAVLAAAFGVWHAPLLFVAFIGALSTVTADTWATEIGVLSPQPPRLITTGRRVSAGTSGGVTALGTLASLLAAAFIGAVGVALVATVAWFPWLGGPAVRDFSPPSQWLALLRLAAISGLLGSLADSLFGATVQATYYCEIDQKETERRVHSCGRATRLIRGSPWIDNDVVNFLSSIIGSGVAVLIWMLLPLST